MSKIVYLNGQYLPLAEAKISVLDRGFLFGDGVYEVIPAYAGHLFLLDQHLQRLENSLAEIRLPVPYVYEQWHNILNSLLTEGQDQYIYLQITRGVADTRDHAFPAQIHPTVFAMSAPIKKFSGTQTGVKAITLDDSRWELCHVKSTTLLANILLRQQAVDQDCAEAILIKNGFATEGAASNIFAVIDGVLTTPPKNNSILPGITRDLILQLAQKNKIPCAETALTESALRTASEIWLSSSTREILPVIELDAIAVADAKPGPVWQKMYQLFQNFKKTSS